MLQRGNHAGYVRGRGPRHLDYHLTPYSGAAPVGVISAHWYSADFGSPSNKRLVAALQNDYRVLPGGYAAGMYIAGQCVEKLGGKSNDCKALAARNSHTCHLAIRSVPVTVPASRCTARICKWAHVFRHPYGSGAEAIQG
jgi:hypothetical protein